MTANTRVRVGLALTNQHPPGSDMVAGLDEQIALVHAARDGGWDSVWAAQHYLPSGMAMLQPLPYLARLAPEAGEMTLGLGIMLLALQNPVDVAESIASLDIVCRGRFIFGVGLGYRDEETDAFAVSRKQRVRRFEDNLRLVERLWTEERVDADLPWCRLHGSSLTLRPVQRPRPPLWMAANGDPAVKRAARMADAWLMNPHATTATIRRQMALFDETRLAARLPPPADLPLMREVFCAADRATALRLAGPYLGAKYAAYAVWGQDKAMPAGETFDLPFEELEAERFIIGSPQDVLAKLLPWRDELGVNYYILRTNWSGMPVEYALQSVELLTREVLPALRAGSP